MLNMVVSVIWLNSEGHFEGRRLRPYCILLQTLALLCDVHDMNSFVLVSWLASEMVSNQLVHFYCHIFLCLSKRCEFAMATTGAA
jgi:hypothetical protein